MDRLIKTLKDINNDLKHIPNINCGGCLKYAHLIAEKLFERNIYYKLKIYFFDGESDKFTSDVSMNSLINGNRLVTCPHAVLSIDKYEHDAESTLVNKSSWAKERSGQLFSKSKFVYPDYIDRTYENSSWNSMFNTKYIEEIKSIINKNFKDYDKDICK